MSRSLPGAPSAPATLTARGLTVSRAGRRVLRGIDLVVAPGHRIGVVGPNGSGKSTLLAALAGLVAPDGGRVVVAPPDATVGLLAQEPERRPGETGLAFLERRTGVAAATAELDAAGAVLAEGGDLDPDGPVAARYDSALSRWLRLGGADLAARAAEVWESVGLPPALLAAEMGHLSGGQAARASLAAVLLSGFDLLLLDEPTNDLDFAALDLLEEFVTSTRAGTVIVSHDRDFLRRTATAVLEIDEQGGAVRFDGGWDAYLGERATARRHAEERYATYVDQRDSLRGRAQREREWSQQGVSKAKKSGETDKFIRHFRTQTSEHIASKARSTDRMLERLEVVDKPWEGWDLQLDLPMAPRSGDLVAELRGAVVERGPFRLGPVDLTVAWADRVGIVGPNGSGKSTLLAALLGRLAPVEGTARLGPGVVVGELDQARAGLEVDRPLLAAFEAASGIDEQQHARSLLAKFGLGADHIARPATSLSPGERTRAELAVLMGRATNCLVLDEPTNHLDLPAIEQLEEALATWPGTVLLVTHDREFLAHAAVTRSVEVADGRVTVRG